VLDYCCAVAVEGDGDAGSEEEVVVTDTLFVPADGESQRV